MNELRKLRMLADFLANSFHMGTLKSVCSSWFGLKSHDKYEHTHLRVPIISRCPGV
jgi:hypothetical protein